jgi:tetratricopeptide (TPR) repeat protein
VFRLFGGSRAPEPPDIKLMAKWFHGTSVPAIENLYIGFLAAFLGELKNDEIVGRAIDAAGLNDDSASAALGEVIRLFTGGGPGAVSPRELTTSELMVASEIYDEIRNGREDGLLTSGVQAALMDGIRAWYGAAFDHAIAVASHIIYDIDNRAGEAYRIRAFSNMALGKYADAITDLEEALSRQPLIRGAKEPLALLRKLVPSD